MIRAIARFRSVPTGARRWLSERSLAIFYARIALGVAFLSGIASRFGLYGKNKGYGSFANFVQYTAQVNSFMPTITIPFLAWAATVTELVLGVLLLTGLWPRWAALGSALLLAMFGAAMVVSMGIKSPLDYSVFSASAAAWLLAREYPRETDDRKEKGLS